MKLSWSGGMRSVRSLGMARRYEVPTLEKQTSTSQLEHFWLLDEKIAGWLLEWPNLL